MTQLIYKNSLLYFLLFISHISCTSSNEPVLKFESFDKQIKLKPTVMEMEIDTELIMKLGTIQVLNEYLFIYDLYSKDQLFWIFNKNTGKFIKKFAHRGRGHNEITNPGFFHIDRRTNEIWINDAGRRKLVKFSLSEVLAEKNPEIFPLSYPKKVSYLTHFYKKSDSAFIYGTFTNKKFLLGEIDTKNQKVRHFGVKTLNDQPNVLKSKSKQYEFFFSQHPSFERYACFYRYYDGFKIINNKGKTLTNVLGPNYASLEPSKNMKMHYREIKSSTNFIYAQYLGKEYFDQQKNEINLPTKLRIFDWKGNPVVELDLGIGFSSFSLDQENDRIICFTEKATPLIYFNFKEKDYL